jgi:hypothetical protein
MVLKLIPMIFLVEMNYIMVAFLAVCVCGVGVQSCNLEFHSSVDKAVVTE